MGKKNLIERYAGREPGDEIERPRRLIVRHHVAGVADQQHGERAVRGRVAGHLGGVLAAARQGHVPDGARRVPELLGARPLERPGHVHGAAVRHDHVQLARVQQHSVPSGVQQRGQPRAHRPWYVILEPLVHRVHRRPRPLAHVQRVPRRRLLHESVPVTALERYRVVVPHHVVDVPHAGQLAVQRRYGDHHLGHCVVRRLEVAVSDPVAGQPLLNLELSFPVFYNENNNCKSK